MQRHEQGGMKLYYLEKMQAKRKEKKSKDYMINCYGPG